MEAMILAAGLGTRMRPLTEHTPKALLPVQGRPLLAHVLDRVVAAGATRVVINTHHHAGQIEEYARRHAPAGVELLLSPEPDGPYDTGGGLLAAAPLLRPTGAFLLHNVDVLSRIPLDGLLATHRTERARRGGRFVASVAVQAREANRRLLFDDDGLMGWENRDGDGAVVASRHAREPRGVIAPWAFTGVHVIEPSLLDHAGRRGTFSIVDWYLDLAREGRTIGPVDVSGHAWLDVGTPERLAEADAGDW